MIKKQLPFTLWILAASCLLFAAAAIAAGTNTTATQQLNTFKVKAYYGKYDIATKKAGHIATSLDKPVIEDWQRPTAKKPYFIGVSFPNLADPYWLAVDYGVVNEARKLGVGIKLLSANGYNDLTGQISQIQSLANQGVDAIIVAPISYGALDGLIKSVTQRGIPVINLVNDIHAASICCKAEVSFFDMGYEAGNHLIQAIQGKKHVTVALLPGPGGASWSQDSAAGFKKALKDGGVTDKVDIIATLWGNTDKAAQIPLIENVTTAHPDLDYLVVNAVGADAAANLFTGRENTPKIISTYAIPPLYKELKDGHIESMSVDSTPLQGEMAVDMAVRVLNGQTPGKDFPFRAGPVIKSATQANLSTFKYETMFGKKGWRPVFSVKANQ